MIEDRRARYRLRSLLADAPPSQQWDQWLRHKADARRVWVHPGVIDRLMEDDRIHPADGADGSVSATAGVGFATDDRATFYVDESVVDELLTEYRAHPSDEGQVLVMVVPAGAPREVIGEPGAPAKAVAALVDLLASPDARERHAAASALDSARQVIIASSNEPTVPASSS